MPDMTLPGWDAISGDPSDEQGAPSQTADRAAAGRAAASSGPRILGVSEVTRSIRGAVRADPALADLWVEGEVGRVTVSSAGHAYFALKDARNQLQCVWFRDDRLRSAFEAQAGLRVVAHGRIDLYEPTGALQLYVETLQPSGVGDLALRFEELKARLAAEGVFAAERKRPLPIRPRTIAVVTSPTGAVWRDICHVLSRRWPLTRVMLVASRVQGEDAPASIVSGLARVERWIAECERDGRPADAPSVTIVARGGGSLEDLWAFNDEQVVRAVVAHTVPVVAGIGHEADVTLTDFAADVRAPTPSAAAELVVPDRTEIEAGVRDNGRRLDGAVDRQLSAATRTVAQERRILERLHPAAQLSTERERSGALLDRATRAVRERLTADRRALERLSARSTPVLPARLGRDRARLARADGLADSVVRQVAAARAGLATAGAALGVLGPQATLDRGYSIVRREHDGAILRDPQAAPDGTALAIRLAAGDLAAVAGRAARRPPPTDDDA
jgi:exodeoxyribonuclease VII large subunit